MNAMTSQGVTYTETLSVMTCGECGIHFAVPEDWRLERKRNGAGWYCPNGHSRVYRETDIQRLERALEQSQTSRDFWQEETRRTQRAHSATKGELTKARKRNANGVCPCCKRSFVQLARHVRTKHPDYEPTNTKENQP